MVRLSLKAKFVLAFVGLTLLFAGTFGVLAAARLRYTLIEQVRLRAKVVAEEFAREAARFIATPEGQTETPQSSRPTRRLVAGSVLYAQIVKDGAVLFVDTQIPLAPPRVVLRRPLEVYERRTADGTPYLDILRAMPDLPLNRQAYVRIGFPLAAVYDGIRHETGLVVLASVAMALLGATAAFVLSRAILGPVDRMLAAIGHLRRGDYSARVQARTRDELRRLADEFNAMAQAIEAHEHELAGINEALRRANRVKDEFTAAMSHELKTPLHAIRASAQLLLEGIDGPLTGAQRKDLELLHAAADHLMHLIDGILRYSALEAGGIAPQRSEVDVAGVIEQARQNVEHLARAKGLAITVDVDGAATVRADETMLRQILINLLHNAVKYTDRGRISVTAAPQQEHVLFTVTDSGPGIAAADAAEVFEPFRRAGDAARREIDGIGLGLAVVKRYVELHGGRVWFESAPERGTTFSFTLPGG
jgi:signal transduction histidine kinase